jgi:hypothetical protein
MFSLYCRIVLVLMRSRPRDYRCEPACVCGIYRYISIYLSIYIYIYIVVYRSVGVYSPLQIHDKVLYDLKAKVSPFLLPTAVSRYSCSVVLRPSNLAHDGIYLSPYISQP